MMIVRLDIGRSAAISSFCDLAIILREIINWSRLLLLHRIASRLARGENNHQIESA